MSDLPRCKTCKHWKHAVYGYGACSQIRDKLEIDIVEGAYSPGCFIRKIETEEDFGCVLHEGEL